MAFLTDLLGGEGLKEKDLDLERKLLHALMDNIPDVIFFKDEELRYIMVSKAHAEMLGLKNPEEAVGKTDFDLYPKEFARETYEDEQRILKTGQSLINKTEKITMKDGTIRWVSTTKVPIYNEEGRITGIVGISRDITDRVLMERRIKEALKYAESIIATVREPLVVLDGDLRVISANRSFYKTFKVTPKETEGRYLYELGNRQWDIPELRQLLEKIIPENISFEDYEVEHNFPKIGWKTMLLNARRVFSEDGETKLILLAIEDVTERKRMEQEMRLLSNVVHQVSEGIAVTDLEGKIIFVNSAWAKMHGYMVEELIGKDVKILYSKPEEAKSFKEETISKGSVRERIGHVKKDGSIFPALTTWTLIKDERGKSVGIAIITRDLRDIIRDIMEVKMLRRPATSIH